MIFRRVWLVVIVNNGVCLPHCINLRIFFEAYVWESTQWDTEEKELLPTDRRTDGQTDGYVTARTPSSPSCMESSISVTAPPPSSVCPSPASFLRGQSNFLTFLLGSLRKQGNSPGPCAREAILLEDVGLCNCLPVHYFHWTIFQPGSYRENGRKQHRFQNELAGHAARIKNNSTWISHWELFVVPKQLNPSQ